MKIKQILQEVLKNGNDLYIKTEENMDVNSLLGMITKISNESFLVEAEWDRAEIIPNAGEIDINEKGFLVFWYVVHDDYFYIEKMDNENTVIEFIKRMCDNMFVPDIIALFDGKKKEYRVLKNGDEIEVVWELNNDQYVGAS